MDIKQEPEDNDSGSELPVTNVNSFNNSLGWSNGGKCAGISIHNTSTRQDGRDEHCQSNQTVVSDPVIVKTELDEWEQYKENFYDSILDPNDDDDDYDESDVIDEDALEDAQEDQKHHKAAVPAVHETCREANECSKSTPLTIEIKKFERNSPERLTIEVEVMSDLISDFCETQFNRGKTQHYVEAKASKDAKNKAIADDKKIFVPAATETCREANDSKSTPLTIEIKKFERNSPERLTVKNEVKNNSISDICEMQLNGGIMQHYIDAIAEAQEVAIAERVAKNKAIANAEKIFVCDICDFKCRYSSNLKTHKRIHDNYKPFKCDVCSFECRHSSYLKTHKLIHVNLKPYTCDECKFRCRSSGHLKKHKMIHYEVKPFTCDICLLKFRQSSHLKRHKIIHIDDKPFSCEQCEYKCKRMSHLQIHKIKHIDVKPYTCLTCQIKFKRSGELKRHEMIHSNVKPFSCELCAFKCRTSTNLKKHRMIHTDIKPFACELCQFKCRQLGNLKKHQLIHRSKDAVVEIT